MLNPLSARLPIVPPDPFPLAPSLSLAEAKGQLELAKSSSCIMHGPAIHDCL